MSLTFLPSAFRRLRTTTGCGLQIPLTEFAEVYDGCTTATVQYIIDKVALIGHVGTLPEYRGNHYARKLLYWIGEKLTADGFEVRLFARPHRVSYYEEIGFKKCGLDIVLERKDTDF